MSAQGVSTSVLVVVLSRGHVSQADVGALSGAGDTLGSDEPAVDWGKDVEESDRAVAIVKAAAQKANLDVPGFQLKHQDSADSGSVICAMVYYLPTVYAWLATYCI